MTAGTINSLSLDGLPFDVAGDADFSVTLTEFENTMTATSGEGSLSQEKRIREVDGVDIVAKSGDDSLLAKMADSGRIDIDMTYVTRGGDTYQGLGSFNVDKKQTKKGIISIKLLPVGEWTESLA